MLEVNNRHIETDASGYLLNVDDWDIEVAQAIAKLEQLELTDAHWEIIHFVRAFYQEYKGNSRYLQRLFPDGPAKQATKLAGLPKPAKCL